MSRYLSGNPYAGVDTQTAYLSPPVTMSAYYLRNVVPQWSLGTDRKSVV